MTTTYENPALSGVKHVLARKYKNLHNLPHWHTEHEIIFVLDGEADIIINGATYRLAADRGTFVMSEQMHHVKITDGGVICVIKVDAKLTKEIIGQKELDSPVLAKDYGVARIYSELDREQKGDLEYADIISDSIAIALVARIFRGEATHVSHRSANGTDGRYKELLEMMASNLAYITFDDAAAHMHFSRSYFSDYFIRQSGMSFTRYLNTLRIASAVELIRRGGIPMTEIAGSCGFGTIRSFNRVFKELTGYSPRELPKDFEFVHSFRSAATNGIDPTLNGSEILYD